MPFVAACPFCPHHLTVPDRAMGACLPCPKCGNYFTVAPSALVPDKNPKQPAAPPKQASTATAQSPPPAELPWWVTEPPQAAIAPASEPPSPPPAPRIPFATPPLAFPAAPPPPSDSSLPEWINVWGVLAFSLAALAMLFAALTLPRWLVLPLAGLGFLLGLIGAAVQLNEWKLKDGIWLALGGGGCGLLLLIGLSRPDWLSGRWGRDFVVPASDSGNLLMVSRSNAAESKEMRSDDRADAAMYAIRHGDLLVRLERAEVQQPTNNEPPILLIALHVENAGQVHIITYHGQGSGKYPAVVRDSRGKELPRRDLGTEAEKRGQIPTVTILPAHEINDLIAVEAPWPGTAHVHVDLPSAAWGREGVCQFTIPSSLLRR
jgi:hypothetical protein